MSSTFALTLWRSFSRGRREKHTWRSFIDTFIRAPEIVRTKKSVAGYSLASFVGNRRALSRVEAVHALVLDFDNGDTTVQEAARLFPETKSVVYTTFSHSAARPKLRVALPLSKPVSADEYARIWDWAARKITRAGHVLDVSTRDASRFWYLPSHRPGAPYEWRELDGTALNVSKALRGKSTAYTRSFPDGCPALERQPAVASQQATRLPVPHPPERGRVYAPLDAPGADQTFFGRAFEHAGMASFDLLENGALPVVCPWADAHTSGVDGDSSTVVFPPTTDGGWGGFHCSHAHCVQRTSADLLDVLPVAALAAARREHGRGMQRVRVIDGWEEHLEAFDEFKALDRFVLKCRPREGGAIFTMTVKQESTLHLQYLNSLPLPLLIGRRIDVSMDDRTVKAARLVVDESPSTKADQRARGATILAAYEPGDSVAGLDFDFLFAVLCRSSRVEAMIGPGVRRIRVREDQRGRFFEVARVDGSCVELGRSL